MTNKHDLIRLRRGTAAEWTASQPQPGGEVLKLGEPGYEKDTGRLKIGDGTTPWNSLAYFNDGTPIDPEELQDLLGDGLLTAGSGININYNDLADTITISTSGVAFLNSPNFTGIPTVPTAPSGTNTTQIASTAFVRTEVSNLVDSAPALLDTLNELAAAINDDANFATTVASGLANKANLSGATFTGAVVIPSGSGNFNTLNVDGTGVSLNGHNHVYTDITNFSSGVDAAVTTLLVAGTGINLLYDSIGDSLTISTSGVSYSGHTHTSSDITDFNSAVSGLLPVKDIVAGTGIGVTSSSGVFTINSSNTVSTDTLEPDGFVNRTDSTISFDDSSREFSIAPKSPATSYAIYNNGVKVVKSSTETTTLPDTTALYFIHFDKSTNNLSYKTTGFNFDTDIPIAQVYYNADDNKAVYFGEERHGIRMDASTHRYLHNVFGTQYVNGLSISNYSTSGDGSADSDATVAIGDGLIYDEDIDVNITNSATPSNPFEQVLYPIAQIPVYYKVGSSGVWTDTTANNFPLKVGTTAQYNLNSAGVWSAANSDAPSNNRYLASWICATSQEHAPIIAIMGQRLDSSLEQATSNNSWGDLNLNGLPIMELRPLYRLIYDTKSSFANGAKAFLVDVLDIRSHIDAITGLPQNDHGNLYGLADDDHYQYIHINEARTIDAIHTFSNGLSASGLINAASGNFTSLTVNSTGVSLEGHTHSYTDITDFGSGVNSTLNTTLVEGSGIDLTYDSINDTLTISSSGGTNISNYGDNRILTSDGTSTGIVAESGFEFANNLRQFKIVYDPSVGHSGNNSLGNIRLDTYGSGITLGNPTNRIIAFRDLGSESSPSGLISGNAILSIRGDAFDSSGNSVNVSRVLIQTEGSATEDNLYVPTKLTINTSSGPKQLDNNLTLDSNGKLSTNGIMDILDITNNRINPDPASGNQVALRATTWPSGFAGSPDGSHYVWGISTNVSPIPINSNHRVNYYGLSATVYHDIPSGVTNSGIIVGTNTFAARNVRSEDTPGWNGPDDNGSLQNLYGSIISYGHSVAKSGVTSYTENAAGLVIYPYKGYGTINNAYDLLIQDTAFNYGTINNHYAIYQQGNRSNQIEGNLTVDNGLSAPTPVYSLGAVSGNTAISYAIDRQIQTLTLNGTSVNFTQGTGWDVTDKSVDVMLVLTVTSTTTVSWTLVDDQYNAFPTFTTGTYLVLLRSIGTTIQGHYIGNKTN